MHKERNLNIELLRIICMFFILMSHLAYHGVMYGYSSEPDRFMTWANGIFLNRWFIVFLFPLGRISVVCFFMIPGFFAVKNNRISSIYKLVTQALFYIMLGVVIYVGWCKFSSDVINVELLKNSVKGIIAPYAGGWWFLTTYLVVYALMPFLNNIYEKVEESKRKWFLILCWIGIVIPSGVVGSSIDTYIKGAFCYLIGLYIRDIYREKSVKVRNCIIILLLLIAINTVITYVNNFHELYAEQYVPNVIVWIGSLISINIIMPLCAILIFIIFSKIKIQECMLVNKISKNVFGVYLFHENPLLRDIIWHKWLMVNRLYDSILFIILSIFIGIIFFVVLLILERVRSSIFDAANNRFYKLMKSILGGISLKQRGSG